MNEPVDSWWLMLVVYVNYQLYITGNCPERDSWPQEYAYHLIVYHKSLVDWKWLKTIDTKIDGCFWKKKTLNLRKGAENPNVRHQKSAKSLTLHWFWNLSTTGIHDWKDGKDQEIGSTRDAPFEDVNMLHPLSRGCFIVCPSKPSFLAKMELMISHLRIPKINILYTVIYTYLFVSDPCERRAW